MIFINVVLPAFLIFLTGFLLMKKFKFDIHSFSNLTFYLLLPVLVFRTLYHADIEGAIGTIFVFEILLTIALIGVIKLVVWWRKESVRRESSLVLSAAFMNAGNYGAPVILFAFGEIGFQMAITFWVIQSVFMSTIGVYFAAKGEGGVREALEKVVRIPAIYAALAALALQYFEIGMPELISRPVDLVADATVPMLMLTLGMQLARVKISSHWEPIGTSLAIRLVASPLLAWGIASWMGIEGLLFKVLILEAAMPAAVQATLLSIQYDREPDIVSSTTLVGTVLSMVTISVLLYILM